MYPGFFFTGGGKTELPKAESGGGVLAEGQNPLPTSWGVWGNAVSSPSWVRGVDPKGFPQIPLFSALRMASPDTIILLIVDYHAAIGGQYSRAPSPWRSLRPCSKKQLLSKMIPFIENDALDNGVSK